MRWPWERVLAAYGERLALAEARVADLSARLEESLNAAARSADLERQLAEALNRGALAEQRYHELVLRTTPPVAPVRVEQTPEVEHQALKRISTESKLRLAEHLVEEARQRGQTIDFATAYEQATTMYDYPENITLSS